MTKGTDGVEVTEGEGRVEANKAYQDALERLEALTNYERTHQPGAMRAVRLERMRRLCQRLGDPQRGFRSIVVTGTNGKGSICAMLYSMLRESPLRTGLYTSPHLEHPRERIRVWTSGPDAGERVHADDWVPEGEFAAAMQQLQPALEAMRRDAPEQPPTYFEAVTALAFLVFRQRRVELAILEVGLGGRLDATNVVDQAVSIIGPVDLDHTDVLGDDPVAIAKEKAGIIKPGQTVLSARQTPEVTAVLRQACEAHGALFAQVGQGLSAEIWHHDQDGLQLTVAGLRGGYEGIELPLIGRHQADNAALAIAGLEACSAIGVPHALVERGLARVEWPGRLELVNEAPVVLMDGAHNPHAARALRETLAELFPGREVFLLVGLSSDKQTEALGQLWGGLAISVTCTKSRHPRALDPVQLAQRIAPFCRDVHVMSDPADAFTYLLNAVPPASVMVVTGSLFLVGELRAAIRQSHIWPKRTRRTFAPAAA